MDPAVVACSFCVLFAYYCTDDITLVTEITHSPDADDCLKRCVAQETCAGVDYDHSNKLCYQRNATCPQENVIVQPTFLTYERLEIGQTECADGRLLVDTACPDNTTPVDCDEANGYVLHVSTCVKLSEICPTDGAIVPLPMIPDTADTSAELHDYKAEWAVDGTIVTCALAVSIVNENVWWSIQLATMAVIHSVDVHIDTCIIGLPTSANIQILVGHEVCVDVVHQHTCGSVNLDKMECVTPVCGDRIKVIADSPILFLCEIQPYGQIV